MRIVGIVADVIRVCLIWDIVGAPGVRKRSPKVRYRDSLFSGVKKRSRFRYYRYSAFLEPKWTLTAGGALGLAYKLCAVIGRQEWRDLDDVRSLIASGEDLRLGLLHAPIKDGGFSPLTLVWILKSFPIETLGPKAQKRPEECTAMRRFVDDFIVAVAKLASE